MAFATGAGGKPVRRWARALVLLVSAMAISVGCSIGTSATRTSPPASLPPLPPVPGASDGPSSSSSSSDGGGASAAERAESPPAEVPTAAGTAVPTTVAQSNACPAAAALSLRDQLKQTLMVFADVASTKQPVWYTEIGGILLEGRDFSSARDGRFVALANAKVPPLVAVDEEGGRVQRIDEIAGPMPSARTQAKTMTPDEVQAMARKRGEALRAIGVTIDFAPVVDLNAGPADGVIGDRSYSADPETVVAYAGAFVRGLQEAGVVPTLKHFPGHGRAVGDSHKRLPQAPALAELQALDLLPYEQLLAEPGPWAVMVGHLSVPGLTSGAQPTSLSPSTYGLLRGQVGFTGLAVTDELSGMRAVSGSYSTAEAVTGALKAGADLALLARVDSITELLDELEHAVRSGRLPAERVADAAQHVLAMKQCG